MDRSCTRLNLMSWSLRRLVCQLMIFWRNSSIIIFISSKQKTDSIAWFILCSSTSCEIETYGPPGIDMVYSHTTTNSPQPHPSAGECLSPPLGGVDIQSQILVRHHPPSAGYFRLHFCFSPIRKQALPMQAHCHEFVV